MYFVDSCRKLFSTVGNGNSESGSTIKLLSVKNSNCGGFATEDMPDKGKYGMDVSYIFTKLVCVFHITN